MSEILQSFRKSLTRDLDPSLPSECIVKVQRLFKLYPDLKVGPSGKDLYCGFCALPPDDPGLSQQTAGFIAGVSLNVEILGKLTGQWRSHAKTKSHLAKDPSGGVADAGTTQNDGQPNEEEDPSGGVADAGTTQNDGQPNEEEEEEEEDDDDDLPLSSLKTVVKGTQQKVRASPPPKQSSPKPPRPSSSKKPRREKAERDNGDDAGAEVNEIDENVPEGGYPRPPEYDSWNWQKQKSWDAILTAPNSFYFRHKPPGEEIKKGPWSEDEQALFWRLLKESGNDTSNIRWGMFSRKIPGRVGYVCRSFLHQNIKRNTLDPSIKVDYSRFHDHAKVRERLLASGDGVGTPTLQPGSRKARILSSAGVVTPTRGSSPATVPAGTSQSPSESPSQPAKTPVKTPSKPPASTPPVPRKKDGRSSKASESSVNQMTAYNEKIEEVVIFKPAPSPHEVMQAMRIHGNGIPLKNPQCLDIFQNSDWAAPAHSIHSIAGVRDKVEVVMKKFHDKALQAVYEDSAFSKLNSNSNNTWTNALVCQHIKTVAREFVVDSQFDTVNGMQQVMKECRDSKDMKDVNRKRMLWNSEEDQLLLDLHELYPGKWRLFKEFGFPDREEGRIMNHWRQITGKNDKHREKERERKRQRTMNGGEKQPGSLPQGTALAKVVESGDVDNLVPPSGMAEKAGDASVSGSAAASMQAPSVQNHGLVATKHTNDTVLSTGGEEKAGARSISGSVAMSVQVPSIQGGGSVATVANPSLAAPMKNNGPLKGKGKASDEDEVRSTHGGDDDTDLDESWDLNGDDDHDLNKSSQPEPED